MNENVHFNALVMLDMTRESLAASRKGKTKFEPFSSTENQMAGKMNTLLDLLQKANPTMTVGEISDMHGWGRLVKEGV